MSRTVFCIADSEIQTEEIIEMLEASGFAASEISVLVPESTDPEEIIQLKNGIAEADPGALGGTLSQLSGTTTVEIPGIGPFIAAGPVTACLNPSAEFTRTLLALGVPDNEARQFQDRLRAGDYLISIQAETPEEIHVAREIFEEAGAEDITVSRATTAPFA